MSSTDNVLPPYNSQHLEPKNIALASGTNNPTLFQAKYGGKKGTRRRKWSSKYKRSINCRRPKGFSQKQYCKYGRRKRKTKNKRSKR
tara:strand:+ start:59 stop:319 length:261 start_codon:yes stop_codon:yes gene_type:complete